MVLHNHFQRKRRELPPAVKLLGPPPPNFRCPPPLRIMAIIGPDQAAVMIWTLADEPCVANVQLAAVPLRSGRGRCTSTHTSSGRRWWEQRS